MRQNKLLLLFARKRYISIIDNNINIIFLYNINIKKTKIMASGPITSWEIDGETVETVADFIWGGLQNHCRW